MKQIVGTITRLYDRFLLPEYQWSCRRANAAAEIATGIMHDHRRGVSR